VAGLVIVVPLVLAYAKPRRTMWSGSRWVELAILSFLMVLASQALFGGWLSEQLAHHLLYIPLIFLVWVCLRLESEARIRAIVETAVDGIITIDERGIIETCNPTVEKMFGYTRDEMIGRNVSLLMPSPEREQHDGHLARYAQTRQRHVIGGSREVRGRRQDGTVFPLDLTVSETRLGDRCFFTGIVRDATSRHLRLQAEKELAATHEQLRLARSIQQGYFPKTAPVIPGFDLGGA